MTPIWSNLIMRRFIIGNKIYLSLYFHDIDVIYHIIMIFSHRFHDLGTDTKYRLRITYSFIFCSSCLVVIQGIAS